jgi:uncharacterized membrane protein YfhO
VGSFPSAEGRTITLWERPGARPRAELVTSLPADIRSPLPETVGEASIRTETLDTVTIAVENPKPADAALILRDTWYPGWEATLDGTPAAIERAETIFRGVRVPPGEHTVLFEYAPASVRTGMVLSALGWLAVGALLLRRRPLGTT